MIDLSYAPVGACRDMASAATASGRGGEVAPRTSANSSSPHSAPRSTSTSRPANAALHAKILVVDGHTVLLGSADLTGRALVANLECGVLIRGGPQAAAVRKHLWGLRRKGVLRDG